MNVVGVDGCRTGWIGVVLDSRGEVAGAHFVPEISSLPDVVGDVAVVGVDMPIGLPDGPPREADVAARRELGPRRHSIFLTPVRAAVEARTHADATAASVRLNAGGVSRQSYALAGKILEVEQWLPGAPCSVFEVHPELSFATLMGRPAAASKKTWAGMVERRRALLRAGIVLDDLEGPATTAATVDDLLDAAAVAWTARRLADGRARPFPDPPPVDANGRAVAIWA